MRIGVIGAGPWGCNHIRIYRELGHEVLACDSSEQALAKAREKFGCETTGEIARIMETCEAVSVCTPASTHYALAKSALDAGRHVLVEKPLAMNAKEARELCSLARKRRKVLMVGHVYRYDPAVDKARQMIAAGELGKAYFAVFNLSGLKNPRSDCGAIFNYAVHTLDTLVLLMGEEPCGIACETVNMLQKGKGLEDHASITIEFPSGARAFTQVGWLDPGKKRELLVVGEKKSIAIDTQKSELHVCKSGVAKGADGRFALFDEGAETMQAERAEPLKDELADFVSCIQSKGKLEPKANCKIGLKTVKLLEAALKAAAMGKRIRFK